MIPVDLYTLVASKDMCDFQVKLSSRRTPRNIVFAETQSIGRSFQFSI